MILVRGVRETVGQVEYINEDKLGIVLFHSCTHNKSI
jgi:hypothetical protein